MAFIAPSLALAACATDRASKTELDELEAEVRALRAENARLEKRLERVELREAVRARPAGGPLSEAAGREEGAALPALTVVKLKPKADAAPRIDTGIPVVEPDPAIVEELKPQSGAPENEVDAETGDSIFENGLSALKTGNISGGVERLMTFAAENPSHGKADNAIYFAGVGLMGLEDYEDAAAAFEKLIGSYPASDAVLDGMLRLAECRLKVGRASEARAVYEKVVRGYPGTAAATQAQSRLASLASAATNQETPKGAR